MDGAKEARFTVIVHHEDGQLWAEVVELPGCFAAGDTMSELGESLSEALALCLPAARVELGEWVSIGRTDDGERDEVRALVGV
jgi:predicted RNase H-like HicB family nuclease